MSEHAPDRTPAVGTLYDVEGAAQRLNVSERWIRRAVAERRIPFVKIGRHVRFRPADLDQYETDNLVPALS